MKRAMKGILFCVALLMGQSAFAGPKFYSQCGQDQFVYEYFFKDKKDGVFLDIGAHDGIFFSNTYFFEKELGWKGICVEPIPEVFSQLEKNRSAICVNGVISNQGGDVDFLRVHGNPPTLEMLSGIIDNYDPRHVQRIQNQIKLEGASSEVIKVKCYDVAKLLNDNGITFVDFLSLDTEGGELEILKSIDFSKVTIDVITVENNYKSPEFKAFLEPLGYRLVAYIEQDEVYKLQKS